MIRSMLKIIASLALGALGTWVVVNMLAGPGVVIIDQVEAEGPSFADPGMLDVVTTVQRNRVCPSQTQRWVWRRLNAQGQPWREGDGEVTEQTIPLTSTVMPFLASSRKLIISIPAPAVPDPEHGGWMFRSVTVERCSALPAQFGELLGTRVFRSKDVPVNFVGAPHGKENHP